MKIVITGGHHNSALPVIKLLYEKYSDIEIYWFGHKHSVKGDKNSTLEYREVVSMGIPFYDIHAGKIYKTFNIVRLAKVPVGIFQTFLLLLKIRPNLILSFGGYIAAPTVLAGRLLRIPSITHEQTIVAGYANRLISKFAKKVLISWPQSKKFFPADKTVITGLPLRPEIFEVYSDIFDINLALPTVYITAGKTGSHLINSAVYENLERLLNICNVIHQCGDHSKYKDYEKLMNKYKRIKPLCKGIYNLKKFIFENEVGEAYKKADVVVSRSGAHTTAEIIALEKPAVLIPISWVSHNEQLENAKMVKDAGLGIILEEKSLTPISLVSMVEHALKYKNRMKLKDEELKSLVRMDSAQLIVEQMEKIKC